jgi:hypothetical protein
MSIATHEMPATSAAARSEMLARTRAELRARHGRLTDRQVELIAEVAVEIRMTTFRMLESFDVTRVGDGVEH